MAEKIVTVKIGIEDKIRTEDTNPEWRMSFAIDDSRPIAEQSAIVDSVMTRITRFIHNKTGMQL